MERITMNIPVLALRGLTAFPSQTLSFDVEREISIYALDNAMENDRRLLHTEVRYVVPDDQQRRYLRAAVERREEQKRQALDEAVA